MADPVITCSSELLSNYKAAEIMAADSAFSALQTDEGHALLFSLGTDGACYLTREAAGSTAGWEKHDLSSALAGDGAAAKQIAVAQNTGTAQVHMALAMTAPDGDALHLSLGNSASDTGWADRPAWTHVPFDAPDHPLDKLVIIDVFVSEAADGEYIVVDVLRDPSSGARTVSRFYIDPARPGGQAWHPHDVANDIEAATVSSALGRRAGQKIDGLYTMGTFGGQAQLTYQPLYNRINRARPADADGLFLPGDVAGDAMAAVRRADNFTDLFVASGRKIYYFAAENQHNAAVGVEILDAPIYAGVQKLFGHRSATRTIIWGLNAAHQVFYTSCAAGAETTGPWSRPLPLREGVHRVAPYVNRANDANHFFVHNGVDRLQRAAQSPATTRWKYDNILLPAPDGKAKRFSAYTTRVQVNDASGRPIADTPVQLSALHRVGVDINGFYQVLDTEPVPVVTDHSGAINIIEWVETPQATPLRVTRPDGSILDINPMDKVMQKAASLGTSDSLKAATVPNKDGTPSDRPLIPTGDAAPSSGDLDAAAGALGQLGTVYSSLPANGASRAASGAESAAAPTARRKLVIRHSVASRTRAASAAEFSIGDIVDTVVDAAESAAGDLVSALESATDYVISLAQEVGSEAWHFVATIAGEAYSFVLDAADKVVGAVMAVYKAIKAAIEELIAWLEFLMMWGDFMKTLHVTKKLLFLTLDFLSRHSADLKPAFNHALAAARASVDAWAGVKATDGWTGQVENKGQSLGFERTLIDISDAFTSPAMYVYNHFVDNMLGGPSDPDPGPKTEALFDAVLAAFGDEADTIVNAIGRLQALIARADFDTSSLEDLLKQATAIVVDAFLEGTETAGDAVIDLFAALLPAGIEALDEHVWIPVVSDILEDVFHEDTHFSWLDFIVLIGAIPATLLYKSSFGSVPFSSGDGFTDQILDADDLEGLIAALSPGAETTSTSLGPVPVGDIPAAFRTALDFKLTGTAAQAVFATAHCIAGVAQMVSAVVVIPALTGLSPNSASYRKLMSACGIVSGLAMMVSPVLVSPTPIRNEAISYMSKITSLILVAVKGMVWLKADTDTEKKVGAVSDAILAMVALVATCYHMAELANEPASRARSAAYIDESTSICNYFNRFAQTGAQFAEDPETKAGLIVAMVVLTSMAAGQEMANACIPLD